MITKYIGSVDSFLNCETVAFVSVSDKITLIQADISKYVPTCELFNKVKLVSRNEDGIFIGFFNEDERDGFILNYIVMYNSLGDPVGFTNLTQDIDLKKYGIESITLSFDYTVVNKSIYITLDVDYVAHLIKTKEKKAHLDLFNSNKGGWSAVSKSTLMGLTSKRQGYTKNILDSMRDPNLIYRYSGCLSRNLSYFSNGSWSIKKELFDQSIYIDIFKLDDKEYVVLYNGFNIKFINESTIIQHDIYIESPLHIGSNFIIEKFEDNQYLIYPTAQLISGIKMPLQTSTMTEDGILVPANHLIQEPQLAKNPIDKSLMFYKLGPKGIETNCVELNKILYDFGNPKLDNELLLYASKGMMFTAKLQSDNTIDTASLYTFNLPGKFINGKLTPVYDNLDNKNAEDLFEQLQLKLHGTNINDIVFITNNLIFINKANYSIDEYRELNKCTWNRADIFARYPDISTDDPYMYYLDYEEYNKLRGSSKFLIEVQGDFNYDPNIYNTSYKLNIINLVGRVGLRNLDKIVKNFDPDLRGRTLMNLTLEGNIYGYIEAGEYYKIGRL